MRMLYLPVLNVNMSQVDMKAKETTRSSKMTNVAGYNLDRAIPETLSHPRYGQHYRSYLHLPAI